MTPNEQLLYEACEKSLEILHLCRGLIKAKGYSQVFSANEQIDKRFAAVKEAMAKARGETNDV